MFGKVSRAALHLQHPQVLEAAEELKRGLRSSDFMAEWPPMATAATTTEHAFQNFQRGFR